ncbi:MAG: TRAP transporter substrate-binding protein [Actinomycetota bacterium]
MTARLAALVLGLGLVLGVAACGDDETTGGGTTTAAGTTTGGAAEVTLKLGYVTTPQHPYGIAVDAFVEEVATASGGRIAIQTIPNYGGDIPLLNDVQGGTVEMATVSSAVWDTKGVKSFQALQAPFLVNRLDLEDQVISGEIGQEMLQGVEKLGLVGLAIHEGGLRKPLGRAKALKNPADFKGLKIRAPESGVLSEGLKALGAEPTPLPVTDVYLALKNGTVDGMEANLGLIDTNKYYEVAKFVTQNVNLWPFPTVLVANKAAFDALSAEDQQIITDAAAKVPSLSIEIFTNPPPTATNFVQSLCDKGLTFAFASDADQAALQDAAKTAIANLSEDPEVKDFIERIQAIKDGLPAPATPPALPAGCKKA